MLASLSALARAQPGVDVSPIIPVHPAVRTTVLLPDEIERVQIRHGGEMIVRGIGSKLYVRPRSDTPAGLEALIEVKTRTLHRLIILQVVERAEDAAQEIVVPAPAAEQAQAGPEGSSVAPAPVEPPAPVPRLEPERVRILCDNDCQTPLCQRSRTQPEHAKAETEPVTLAPVTEAATERAGARRTSPFALSVHAVAALGTTAIHVAGYSPIDARRSHHALGLRVTGHPHDTWWAVEGNVTWESLVAPTTHTPVNAPPAPIIAVYGPRLRADAGLRGRFGTTVMATFYTGIGLQAHHLDIEAIADPEHPMSNEGSGDLPFEGVLALGMGLEYRVGNVVLGLDLHIRQGVPGEYRSVSGILSVGFFLDQGE
jgi:hypothetical protein